MLGLLGVERPAHVVAVDLGEVAIEQHDVVGVHARLVERLRAVGARRRPPRRGGAARARPRRRRAARPRRSAGARSDPAVVVARVAVARAVGSVVAGGTRRSGCAGGGATAACSVAVDPHHAAGGERRRGRRRRRRRRRRRWRSAGSEACAPLKRREPKAELKGVCEIDEKRHTSRPNQRIEPATPPNISSSAPPANRLVISFLRFSVASSRAEPLVDLLELLRRRRSRTPCRRSARRPASASRGRAAPGCAVLPSARWTRSCPSRCRARRCRRGPSPCAPRSATASASRPRTLLPSESRTIAAGGCLLRLRRARRLDRAQRRGQRVAGRRAARRLHARERLADRRVVARRRLQHGRLVVEGDRADADVVGHRVEERAGRAAGGDEPARRDVLGQHRARAVGGDRRPSPARPGPRRSTCGRASATSRPATASPRTAIGHVPAPARAPRRDRGHELRRRRTPRVRPRRRSARTYSATQQRDEREAGEQERAGEAHGAVSGRVPSVTSSVCVRAAAGHLDLDAVARRVRGDRVGDAVGSRRSPCRRPWSRCRPARTPAFSAGPPAVDRADLRAGAARREAVVASPSHGALDGLAGLELRHDLAHGVRRDREADADVPAARARGGDLRVHADHAPAWRRAAGRRSCRG